MIYISWGDGLFFYNFDDFISHEDYDDDIDDLHDTDHQNNHHLVYDLVLYYLVLYVYVKYFQVPVFTTSIPRP